MRADNSGIMYMKNKKFGFLYYPREFVFMRTGL